MGARTVVPGMPTESCGPGQFQSRMCMLGVHRGGLTLQGGEWARSMPKDGLWPLIIAPPAIGGTCDMVSGALDAWMQWSNQKCD